MLYRGMDRAALDVAYNNTEHIGQKKRDDYVASWAARSEAFRRSTLGKVDLRYGRGPRQRLDIYPCGTPHAPTLVYYHGGYWQANDKELYSFIGEGVLPAGFNLVLVEYTLAPAARMDDIVGEARRSVAWVIDHASDFGGAPARVIAAGHSAGGHLAAMAMTEPRLAGGLAISGVYDLEPIRLNYLNEKLQLDGGEAERNSPVRHLPKQAAPLIISAGLAELPELVRQSEEYAAAWLRQGRRGKYVPLPNQEHFSTLEELARPQSSLIPALVELARTGAV